MRKLAPIESPPMTSKYLSIQSFPLSATVWPKFQWHTMVPYSTAPFGELGRVVKTSMAQSYLKAIQKHRPFSSHRFATNPFNKLLSNFDNNMKRFSFKIYPTVLNGNWHQISIESLFIFYATSTSREHQSLGSSRALEIPIVIGSLIVILSIN